MGDRFFEASELEQDGLRLELVVQPAISYALVVNRLPLVRKVTLTNRSPLSAFDLSVELTLAGPAGPVAPAWRVDLASPVPPGRSVTWEEIGRDSGPGGTATPDPQALRATTEAYPVEFQLTVTRPEAEPVRLVLPTRVLAHDEWLNHPGLYDVLPAFVQPDTPAVDEVLRRAAGVLARQTGSDAIQGYQAGPARAAQIAGAVYEALRQIGIGQLAAVAPAGQGQRIRTVSAVLESRSGTGLDLAVTYAACLARAGLHPLLWLGDDYAVGGFFLEAERLAAITVTEANLLTSLADAGRAVAVDLSGLGTGRPDFATAVRAGSGVLRSPDAPLRAAVDVALAHRCGIAPLPPTLSWTPAPPSDDPAAPATVAEASIELPPGAARDRLVERAAETAEVVDERDPAPPRVRQWKRALLDLSLRNPLLNLPVRGKGVELHVPADALKDLDDLMHQGKRVTLVAQDAVSQVHQLAGTSRAQELDPQILARELREQRRIYAAVTTERYRTVCSGLQRAARTMLQETGSNYLYLTLGTLVHPKDNGTWARAPLFLLPVRIEGGFGRAPYQIVVDGTETAWPNHCLVEWLRVKHRVRIPELEHPILDEAGIDIPRTLQALRDGLVAHELNYRIDESASLRLLQFSTFQMWRDLTDHWESFLENPVVRHLVHRVDAEFVDPAAGDAPEPVVDEAALHLPIEADGSQMQAVLLAEQGRSFVLEGPPGTGKSQTITNMIARAIHSGRTVLFVAEKQAALEVVKRRLDKVGLGPFVLDLHGRKQSLNAIRAQLREALEQTDTGDDAAFDAAAVKYRAQLGPLARYPHRVHGSNAAGFSLWRAYQDVLRYGEGPTSIVPSAYLHSDEQTREAVARALAELPPIAHAARPRPDHPWALAEVRDTKTVDHETAVAVAERLEAARQALLARPGLAAVVASLPAPHDVTRLLPAAALVRDATLPDREVTRWAEQSTWDTGIAYVQDSLAQLWRNHGAQLHVFRDDLLRSPQLDEWAAGAAEAADKFLPWSRNKGLQRIAEQLTPYLRGGQPDPGDLPGLLSLLVAARLAAVDLEYQVGRVGGLRLPPGWRPTRDGAQEEFAAAVQATRISRALLREAPQAWEYFTGGTAHPDDHAVLAAVDQGWREWTAVLGSSVESLRRWHGNGSWWAAWQRDGEGWLRELRDEGLGGLHRWGALLAGTDPLREAGLTSLRDQVVSGELDADDAEQAYRRGLAATALAERVQAGDLAFFEPGAHNGRIDQYESAAAALREAVIAHLPARLVRRRGSTTDPELRERARVELAEQLKRKRGGMSFRELFATYAELIQTLTPCVLVSPASAAQFIPPSSARFDIVIFDEASQIRVAEAIGAMGRGRSSVIVGDSRQMPPTAIMQASHDDAEEPVDPDGEPVPEDLDSILSEAVESRVPQHWLSWHYRSRDESLIAFSNRRYYGSKLYSLPSPTAGGQAAVVWRRVAGEFDRGRTRTNRVEAQLVVEEIRRRLADPATAAESIGVVTFNIQQRDLILDLLEASDDPLVAAAMAETLEEPIFVKNLENVQGDERDTILFSLAFSVDPRTGLLPLNFGPLSQAGGERRLNVAITRAKRLVMLFASFDPSDIDLSRTTAQGTRDLRAYCEMAANGTGVLGDLAVTRSRQADEVRALVAAAIRDRGHDVVVGHGLSDFTVDIAVRRPGAAQWQVAIILDGPDWARRSTVADRDGAPRYLSRHMSWPVLLRFWLPGWLRDKESFLREVDDAVRRATEQEFEAARRQAEREQTTVRSSPEQAVRSAEQTPASAGAPEPEGTGEPAPPRVPKPRARARAKAAVPVASDADTPAPTTAKRTRKKATPPPA